MCLCDFVCVRVCFVCMYVCMCVCVCLFVCVFVCLFELVCLVCIGLFSLFECVVVSLIVVFV